MFVHNGQCYAYPTAYGPLGDPNTLFPLLNEAEQERVPWAELRFTNLHVQTNYLFDLSRETYLSARFPDTESIWMRLVDGYLPALMGHHPRLGENSPLRLIDKETLYRIIEMSMGN